MGQPSNACTISTAVDGDVAFFIEHEDFLPRSPCIVRIDGDVLSILQEDVEIVRVAGVSAARIEDVRRAGKLMVVNVQGADGSNELISIVKDVVLIER